LPGVSAPEGSMREGERSSQLLSFLRPACEGWCGWDLLTALILLAGVITVLLLRHEEARKALHWKRLAATHPGVVGAIAGFGWSLLTFPTMRPLIWAARMAIQWCRGTVWYYTGEMVQGYVAFTIDDVPGATSRPLMDQVLRLLDKYEAKATFFVISGQARGSVKEGLLRKAVQRGHELANHCVEDIPYHNHSELDFEEALLSCESLLTQLTASQHPLDPTRKKWFRPPQGRCSGAMWRVLGRHGYASAMTDCFGMDTVCVEPYVSSYVASRAQAGSVVLMHLPEKGFREHNLEAIEVVLRKLQGRGLRAVTLSELDARAEGRFEIQC